MKNVGNFSISGTDIDEVKQKNEQSGMSYNEVKAYIAKTTGGQRTNQLSDTFTKANINKSKQ
ncbi:gamma-type small acid-soluble spore protein [Aquibacillus saliphilus]|uniref:gamma-type small acid-soluble spore protein n=1 Tax=Aquibacillus saliphilus TaxID=1909422 RepID=UPI001CF0BCE6|nr:gamma-type small acid-soluble spore protein [Aquibacillus saliphilus]